MQKCERACLSPAVPLLPAPEAIELEDLEARRVLSSFVSATQRRMEISRTP